MTSPKRHLLHLGLCGLVACGPVQLSSRAPSADAVPVPKLWTPTAISTAGYESSPTFTPDGQEMYFVSADRNFRNYRILRSRCERGAWSAPEPAAFGKPLPIIEADPFVTRDGRRLYFVSSRQAPDREDFDIWFVERLPNGEWGTAQRLPEPVNSPGAELLPRVAQDGTLYFGSDRPGGFGQSDIYAATRERNGRWKVANVGPPVSTSANEYEAEVASDQRTMIVVADRGVRSHLYRFVKQAGTWVETGLVPAADNVFQVGPALSPRGDRLLFAQADGERSGEIYIVDLKARPDLSWPPCGTRRSDGGGKGVADR
jgi:Tol biopolymer transport system component